MRYLRHSTQHKRTAALISRSIVACFALFAFASTSAGAQSALGLSVNGQTVVPRGQLKSFAYDVANARIQARSFFGDIRCNPGDQNPAAPSGLSFELDMFSANEPEASYRIFETGEIRYDTTVGMINVTTSSGALSGCTHFIDAVGAISPVDGEADPGAFWAGGFESPFRLESETMTPAVIGDKLSIRFTLTNTSELLVATGMQAPFAFTVTPFTADITGPDFNTQGVASGYVPSNINITGNLWEIPILWPGESAAVIVSYTLNASAPLNVEITTTVDSVTALDRTESAPLASSTPQVTVMAVSSVAP